MSTVLYSYRTNRKHDRMQRLFSQYARTAIVLTALIWSTGGVVVKTADCSAMVLTALRCLFANAVLIAVFYRQIRFTFSKVQIAGAISYCSMACTYALATKLTTAANAVLLQYSAPVFVAILSWYILKEKITRQDRVTVGCVFVGMVLFFSQRLDIGSVLGNVLGLVSGISFAIFVICSRLQKDSSPVGAIILGNSLAFLLGVPEMLSVPPTADVWLSGIYFGVVYGGLAFVFYTGAIVHVSAITAILIATIEPVLNPVWVFLVVGEVPGISTCIGAVVVISALIWRNCVVERQKFRQ